MLDHRQQLDKLLNSAFKSIEIPDTPVSLYEPVKYTLSLGGKRLRPRLVMLTAGLCGGDPQRALPAALAVELLHNFTLMHDDIMDRAETRRGKPSIHAKWDDSTAILAGDVTYVLAMKQLGRYTSVDYADVRKGESNKSVVKNAETDIEALRLHSNLTALFLDTVQTICDGQAMDMDFETREQVEPDEYIRMICAKTAALIRCSMEMGALIANADNHTRALCAKIGEHAGLAFQIQDDLLDVVGDSSKFGKKTGGDILEGKKTWLSILALERADDTDRAILSQIFGNKNIGESEILRVIRIYHDLGVIDDAVREIASHYNDALKKLSNFEDSAYRREIKTLLDKLKVRDN